MAKVYKVTLYVSDYNEEMANLESLDNFIDERLGSWMGIRIAESKESEGFEWHDDLKINYGNATLEDYEKYFRNEDMVKEIIDTQYKILAMMYELGIPITEEFKKRTHDNMKYLIDKKKDC